MILTSARCGKQRISARSGELELPTSFLLTSKKFQVYNKPLNPQVILCSFTHFHLFNPKSKDTCLPPSSNKKPNNSPQCVPHPRSSCGAWAHEQHPAPVAQHTSSLPRIQLLGYHHGSSQTTHTLTMPPRSLLSPQRWIPRPQSTEKTANKCKKSWTG